MTKTRKVIALEARLKGCKNVITLGVKSNFTDYTACEADLIRKQSLKRFSRCFEAGKQDKGYSLRNILRFYRSKLLPLCDLRH